jgi:hypothetical protein
MTPLVPSRRSAQVWHQWLALDVDPGRGPRRKPWATGFSLACLVMVAAACSSTAAAKTTTSTTTTSSSVTTITADSQASAVLAAYRAGWAAFEQAQRAANPYEPGLPATMVDPLLQLVRRTLLSNQDEGIIIKGSITLHPKLQSLGAQRAVVVDCAFDGTELVYRATGKPVPPVTPPQRAGVHSVLVRLTSGAWKVADQSVTEGSCPAGY